MATSEDGSSVGLIGSSRSRQMELFETAATLIWLAPVSGKDAGNEWSAAEWTSMRCFEIGLSDDK